MTTVAALPTAPRSLLDLTFAELERLLQEQGRAGTPLPAEQRGTESAPYLKPATTITKKVTPLKSLGSLDQLFRK